MTSMRVYRSTHPEHVERLGTAELRANFLAQNLFRPGEMTACYANDDRMLFGGIMPMSGAVCVSGELTADLGSKDFLDRRELGLVNVGGPGWVEADRERHGLQYKDAIYLAAGSREPRFGSEDPEKPAKFFYNTVAAHARTASKRVTLQDAPTAIKGGEGFSGFRKITRYIAPDLMPTCQLVMGMTELEDGTLWNTLPTHTHANRSELYFYFEMAPENYVIQLMGRPSETRHLIVRDEEAVIVPGYSIHTGVGTGRYALIWSMCGENQDAAEFTPVPTGALI